MVLRFSDARVLTIRITEMVTTKVSHNQLLSGIGIKFKKNRNRSLFMVITNALYLVLRTNLVPIIFHFRK